MPSPVFVDSIRRACCAQGTLCKIKPWKGPKWNKGGHGWGGGDGGDGEDGDDGEAGTWPRPYPTGALDEAVMMAGVRFWHDVASETSLLDYSRTTMDPEQPVITYASRAQAMVHIAIYDAYVGITKSDATYYDYSLPPVPPGTCRHDAWKASAVHPPKPRLLPCVYVGTCSAATGA
jgi:hypothetical protein